MPRTSAITVRLDPALKAQLEKLAQKDDRSTSQFMERLLIAYLTDVDVRIAVEENRRRQREKEG